METDIKGELLAAIVDIPQPGQRVIPIKIRLPYAGYPSVQYIDVSLLPAKTAAALQSAHNSLKSDNTSASSSFPNKLDAMARAVRTRSYNWMAASTSTAGKLRRLSTSSRASNASLLVNVSVMVSPVVGLTSMVNAA